MPSGFANHVGGQLMEIKRELIKSWLDDIPVPSKSIAEHSGLLRANFKCLKNGD